MEAKSSLFLHFYTQISPFRIPGSFLFFPKFEKAPTRSHFRKTRVFQGFKGKALYHAGFPRIALPEALIKLPVLCRMAERREISYSPKEPRLRILHSPPKRREQHLLRGAFCVSRSAFEERCAGEIAPAVLLPPPKNRLTGQKTVPVPPIAAAY